MCPFLLEYLKIYIFCKDHLFFWPLPLVQIFQQMQLYVNIIIQKKIFSVECHAHPIQGIRNSENR